MTVKNSVISIQRLKISDVEDFKALIQLFIEVFEENSTDFASDKHLERLLNNEYFSVFVAKANDRVVGGLTAYELIKYYSNKSELYIYDIAVAPTFQKKGVGRLLMEALKNYCAVHSIDEMFVEAHTEDETAVKFYQSTLGEFEEVAHFNYRIG